MTDDLDLRAARARDDLTRAVDEAAPVTPPVAGVARRAARRRAGHAAIAVAAVMALGAGALWSTTDHDRGSNIVAGQPETTAPRTFAGAGNRCFRPTYLPAGFGSEFRPGPALAGGPITGVRDEVSHWGDALRSIDVAVADPGTANVPVGGDTHFAVLGTDATAGVVFDSGGGTHEWVAFSACGRSWVLSATHTDDGRGTPAGEVRLVAEGLVPGDPNQPEPTGVTGILFAYSKPDPQTPIPKHGPTPGAGPTAGRAKAVANGVEVAKLDVPDTGRFMMSLPPGEYDIVATFEADDRLCGQQRVSVVQGRVRSLTFTCQR